jgi:hypothetical protein
MKRLVMSIALACALSSTALAGIIPTTDYAPPPQPPPPESMQATPGDISTYEFGSPETTSSMLSVLMTILSAL